MNDYSSLSPIAQEFLGHVDAMTERLETYESKLDIGSLSDDVRMTHTALKCWLGFFRGYVEDGLIR